MRRAVTFTAAAIACALAAAPTSEGAEGAPGKPALPRDVSSCAAAVDRIVAGHRQFNRFIWDRDDPGKYIHSTMMPETEFRGKLVPVDYTLILVGQLRQRRSGQLVDGKGVCGMRSGRIVTVRVEPSPPTP